MSDLPDDFKNAGGFVKDEIMTGESKSLTDIDGLLGRAVAAVDRLAQSAYRHEQMCRVSPGLMEAHRSNTTDHIDRLTQEVGRLRQALTVVASYDALAGGTSMADAIARNRMAKAAYDALKEKL